MVKGGGGGGGDRHWYVVALWFCLNAVKVLYSSYLPSSYVC